MDFWFSSCALTPTLSRSHRQSFSKLQRAGEGDVEVTFCVFPNFRERKSENISAEKNLEGDFNVPLSRSLKFGKTLSVAAGARKDNAPHQPQCSSITPTPLGESEVTIITARGQTVWLQKIVW